MIRFPPRFATFAWLALVAATAAPAVAQGNPILPGIVTRVVDGDTLKVQLSSGTITVRLDSIDAPERNQPGGSAATAALQSLVGNQQVDLEVVTQDRYERLVAVVYLGGTNVNAELVKSGLAWTFRRYATDPDYCRWEAAARDANRGLWARPPTDRIAPWEYRALKRGQRDRITDYTHETAEHCIATLGRKAIVSDAPPATEEGAATLSPTATSAPQTGACLIKGNISKNGKIYHVPGSSSYEATKIDESKGERWFCSQDEARAAGWRPPRG